MCGIFFSCSRTGHEYPSGQLLHCLQRRGPDSTQTLSRAVTAECTSFDQSTKPNSLTFLSTVLSLRGESIVTQPLEDPSSDSLLCWNGEAWKIGEEAVDGNDGLVVFGLFLKAIRSNKPQSGDTASALDGSLRAFLDVIARISGPYAFVFYDALHRRIFFGRDVLGRRSLVFKNKSPGRIIVSSVCDPTDKEAWTEVEAHGIYMLDLQDTLRLPDDELIPTNLILRTPKQESSLLSYTLTSPFPSFNNECPISAVPSLKHDSSAVDRLWEELKHSIIVRIRNIPTVPSMMADPIRANPTRVAVLFSGGLDCTVLARLIHDFLPSDQEIDLLNVAFENPRVVQAAANDANAGESSPFDICPDRMTGLSSHAELQDTCSERTWRFIAIDISYTELQEHRSVIVSLIHPHNTEMDFSIACALYFAARGSGTNLVHGVGSRVPYTTAARTLFSGLGADELFGGYTRHATAFNRRSFEGLITELQFDFNRLGQRNLGRDDRVLSHWGKEARYPYLDEDLLSWALSIPVWEKCGFGCLDTNDGNGSPAIEPGKKILRLLARKLGLQGASMEKKRAIQFGARSARMEAGRTRGTQVLSHAS